MKRASSVSWTRFAPSAENKRSGLPVRSESDVCPGCRKAFDMYGRSQTKDSCRQDAAASLTGTSLCAYAMELLYRKTCVRETNRLADFWRNGAVSCNSFQIMIRLIQLPSEVGYELHFSLRSSTTSRASPSAPTMCRSREICPRPAVWWLWSPAASCGRGFIR